jgi:hypothetical protein
MTPANGRIPDSELAPIKDGQLLKECAAAWNALNEEARRNGIELVPTGSKSSYRTYAQQVELYQAYLNGTGNLAARPGTSNHGWGHAVDVATPEMRRLIDQIGSRYGFSKQWSDAQSEWWHICYERGHWSGDDPGPEGQAATPQAPTLEEGDMITAVLKQNGAIEVFVEKSSNGEVFHAWQNAANAGWAGAEAGKRSAGWYSLGTPGK